MIIKSFFAFYYFLFLLGATAYVVSNSFKNIEDLVLSSIIYSLSLSWFFIYFLNVFNLNFSFINLLSLFLISIVIIFFNKSSKINISANEVYNFTIYFFAVFIILFIILIFDYIPVFVHGDAVFQWNGRWAWLLYLNEYKPNGTYPVFWPGLWALIYKTEASFENWIIPSLSQFILPVLLIVTLYLILKIKKFLFFYNLLFILLFFWTFKRTALVGYMDTNIAILYLLFFYMFIIYLISTRKNNYLLLFCLIAGIGSITKQVGFLMPFISSLFILILFFKQKINFYKLIFLVAISFLFLITFLSFDQIFNPFIFFYDLIFNQNEVDTNFGHLQSEAAQNHIQSFIVIFESFNNFAIILILFLSVLNLTNLDNDFCKYGVLVLFFSIIGFYFFSKYGSYDERNGRFIIAMIFSSSNFYILSRNFKDTAMNFKIINNSHNFNLNNLIIFFITLILFLSIIFSKIVNFDKIQFEIQSQLGTIQYKDPVKKKIPKQIYEIINSLPDCSKVFVDEHIIAYNYYLIDFYDLNKNVSKIRVFNFPNEFIENTNFSDCKGPILWYFKKKDTFSKIKNNKFLNNFKINKLNNYLYLISQK